MKQWVYTTSCWNIRGRSGWNTFSYSKGLSEADVEELEQKAYVDNTLDESFFPIYSIINLESGRQAVCQTVTLGKSFYDGRRGALLTHAIVKERDEAWPLLPVAYFGADVFWKKLPDKLIRKALEFRDNAKRFEPPPYLPEVSVSELHPSPLYTQHSIEASLKNDTFAGNLSCLLDALGELDSEQYPLTYTCAPTEYTAYLAALCYLRPDLLQAGGVVSLQHSRRSASHGGNISVAGCCDRNAMLRLDGSETELHPLVQLARNNINSACTFFDRWRHIASGDRQNIRRVTDILAAENILDDTAAADILQLTQSNILFQAALELASTIGSKTLSLRQAENIAGLLNFLFSTKKSAAQYIQSGSAWYKSLQNSISALLEYVSVLVVQDKLDIADFLNAARKSASVFCSCLEQNNLPLLLSAGTTPQQCAHLLQLPLAMQLEQDKTGTACADWTVNSAVTALLAGVAGDEQATGTLLSAARGNIGLTLQLLLALYSAQTSHEHISRAVCSHLAEFSAEQLCSMLNLLQQNKEPHITKIICDALSRHKADYPLLRLIFDSLNVDTSIKNTLLYSILQSPLPEPYTEKEAELLCKLLEQHPEDELTRHIVQTLDSGFPVTRVDKYTMGLAGYIHAWLEHFEIRDGNYPYISILASLDTFKKNSPIEQITEWIENQLKPSFSTTLPEKDKNTKLEFRQAILNRLLSRWGAETKLHIILMRPNSLWELPELIHAYSVIFKSPSSHQYQQMAYALISALWHTGDLHLANTVLPQLAPDLSRILHREDISHLYNMLSAQQKEHKNISPELLPQIFRHFKQQKIGVLHRIINFFFQK